MTQIAVFVKRNGVLVACRALPAPDGCTWQCGICGLHPVMRASFGVLGGMWRCQCGAELEIIADGKPVPIGELSEVEAVNVPAKPKRKRRRKLSDVDFLRECGIANPEESK